MSESTISPEQAQRHWGKTKSLMFISLAVWFIFSFAIHYFAADLNSISFIGFPLGFYMAAQGSLIVFVILIFWFARQQNKIDEDCGVAEE